MDGRNMSKEEAQRGLDKAVKEGRRPPPFFLHVLKKHEEAEQRAAQLRGQFVELGIDPGALDIVEGL